MSLLRSAITDRATDASYAAAWRLVRGAPEPVARLAFQGAADVASRRNGHSVRQLRRNLARIVGADGSRAELDRLVHAGMRSYARYWLETFRLPSMDVDEVLANTRTTGFENVQAPAAAGRGVVVALPHSGNWDVAGLWLVRQGLPFTTVAERLKPETLFDKFVAYRESLGMQVLPLTGGPRPPMEVLKQRLTAGGVVCLVADRDLSRSGIEVDFFGETARMPAGPSMLAAVTGAALVPAHLFYEGSGWGQYIGPPVDLGDGDLRAKLTRGTQALADVFAQRVARHPQDWHMLQRLWLADLDQERLRSVQSGPGATEPSGPSPTHPAPVTVEGS